MFTDVASKLLLQTLNRCLPYRKNDIWNLLNHENNNNKSILNIFLVYMKKRFGKVRSY